MKSKPTNAKTESRSIHEVAFRLAFDMRLQIAPRSGADGVGITTHQMRIVRLVAAKDRVTLMDVVDTLKRDKAQVTRLINGMEKLGLIRRAPNPNDGRSKILVLADKGAAVIDRMAKIEAEFSKQLTRNLSTEDLETFFRVADKLSDNLKDIDGEATS